MLLIPLSPPQRFGCLLPLPYRYLLALSQRSDKVRHWRASDHKSIVLLLLQSNSKVAWHHGDNEIIELQPPKIIASVPSERSKLRNMPGCGQWVKNFRQYGILPRDLTTTVFFGKKPKAPPPHLPNLSEVATRSELFRSRGRR